MNPTSSTGYWTTGAVDPSTNTVGTGTFVQGTPPPVTPTGGSAVVNAPTPATPVSTTVKAPEAPTNTTPANPNIPQGWDAQTYANFKAANPTLEPNAQDVRMGDIADLAGNKAPGSVITAGQQFLSDQAANQAKTDQLNAVMTQKLDAFTNGTVPLNAYEQSQIDATKASYQSIIAAQQLANKNYEGGVAVTNQTSGLDRYSPMMAAGNTLAAVSEGLKKVSDLNTQMNQAVAQMQQSFQQNNYNQVKDQYNILLQAQKDKTAEIEKTYTVAQQAEADLKTQQREQVVSYADSALFDPSLSLDEKKQILSDVAIQGNLTSAQLKDLQDSLQQQIDNVPGSKPLTGLQGEYQYYMDQERAAGRSPLSFFDFKNYQTNATIDAGINPITGQPLTKADQAALDESHKQDQLDLQTVNSAYTSIEGILFKYGVTPDTFDATTADKMNDIDVETIAKAVARIQNPDISRMGGDAGNALDPTSLGEKTAQLWRALSGGKKYLPEKVVDAVGAATAAKNKRQSAVDNPVATQMSNNEISAASVLTDFVTKNMDKKELVASMLETPDAAFGGKPPTHLQVLQALRDRGIIK